MVDVSILQDDSNYPLVSESLKRQVDIVEDSGVKPEILNFFHGRRIALRRIPNDDGPGRFVPGRGIELNPEAFPPEEPILLHELLHAYHALVLPNGFENEDVLGFYRNAVNGRLYPPRKRGDKYVLSNVKEFFAVTASLYLWGRIDRQPYTRENLQNSQPHYYNWLAEQFGVQNK